MGSFFVNKWFFGCVCINCFLCALFCLRFRVLGERVLLVGLDFVFGFVLEVFTVGLGGRDGIFLMLGCCLAWGRGVWVWMWVDLVMNVSFGYLLVL